MATFIGLKMLKLLLWLHRQDSWENIELFHVKLTALLNAGHKILNYAKYIISCLLYVLKNKFIWK